MHHKIVFLLVVSLLATSSFTVAGSSNEQVEKNVITIWRSIKKSVPQMTTAELKKKMDKGETFVLLDVRSEADYQAAHLPGSLHISRGELEFAAAAKIPDTDTPIYVYCRTGVKATFAAKTLLDIGYSNVTRISDSFKGWLEAGYPVYNRHGEFVLLPNGFEKKE